MGQQGECVYMWDEGDAALLALVWMDVCVAPEPHSHSRDLDFD